MTVLPFEAPVVRRAWWRLPARRPPAALLALRGLGAAGLSWLVGVWSTAGLGLVAFVLIPTCTYSTPSPPTLKVAAAGCLLIALAGPLALAGRRLWWVGAPAAGLAVHGVWPIAWPLLTELQSGFCF